MIWDIFCYFLSRLCHPDVIQLFRQRLSHKSVKAYATMPIGIPFGFVAYGFVGQPFSKRLYNYSRWSTLTSGALAWMLSLRVIKWWRLLDYLINCFSQRWQGMRQEIRARVLICSFMRWTNGRGDFFKVESTLIVRIRFCVCFVNKFTIQDNYLNLVSS